MRLTLFATILFPRRAFITLLFLTLISSFGYAQPLSGAFTVGSGGTYPTLSAAVTDLTTRGVNGPVTFRLRTGSFNEQIIIGAITGASATNSITFEAESGNATDAILTFETTSTNNYVIQLDNASFITLRNLSLQPTGSTHTRAIHGINNLNSITFQQLQITLPSTTSVTEERGAIILRPTLSTNIRFLNNTITGGSNGILHIGNNSARSPGTVFTGNTITNVFARPVYVEYMQDIIFNDNTISNTTAWSDYYGAGIQNTTGYLEMLRNRITGSTGHALRLYYCSGLEAQPSIIANNFFHSNSSYATFYILYGLNYTNIYHNSVNNTSSGEAFHFNRHQSTGNRIVNNIFRANTAHAVEFQTSTAVNSILESNYNNLFTSGSFLVRDVSAYYGTLEQWRTASGFETNSVFFDPQFASNTSLYASAPGIASAGKNLFSVVPADIDGTARTITPSIGANQFSAAALTPLSGTYTVGTGQTYTTINAAIDAMKVNGISGPVTFLLNTQTFAERFILPSISGSSSTNTITFQAQSGNAADVVLAPPAAADATTNYIAQLSNATFVKFRNLTFTPGTGTNFNRAILVINRADDITFENLVITLPATTSVTEDRAAILARPSTSTNIRFINNTITGGSQGIVHIGNNSARSPGTVFTGNTITNVFARPVYFEYMQDIIFNDNTISNTTAWSDYYGAGIQNTTGYLEMLRNRITGSVGHAVRLYYCSGLEAQPSIIANNFFHSNSSYATFYILYGLNHTNIYHNSVNNTSSGNAFHFDRWQSTGNRIVNNIFSANTAHAIEFQTSSVANSVLESNYNNLFTSGSFLVRDVSAYYGTLEQWRTASGFETNSVFFDPQFASNTSLYAFAPGIASAGKNLFSVVPADIDGTARTITPSIGANQFSAAALTPLSGTYTVGTGQTYTTINAAIDAMKVNGINGPVTFLLSSQTFAERFILPSISGSSSTNTITFQAQSGNAADVVIAPPAATDGGTNYIAQLSNATFVTFRNLSFTPGTGTNFNRAIHVINRADDITFENLVITLPATTSVTEDRTAILVRPSTSTNIRFINNTITGGSHGIIHVGNNSSRSPGTVFTGNTITNVYARPVYFEYMQDIIFNDNTISNTTAWSDYYGAGIQNTTGYLEMLRNRITGSVGHAVRLYYCSGLEAQPSIIANNFFHSNSSYATFYILYGLNYTNIYHNSVNNTSSGEAFHFNRHQSTGNRIVNNIFRANTAHAVEFQTSTAVNSILESNYNNLFTSGSFLVRDVSAYYGTLEQWRTASGFETNSVFFDPQFASNTSLYASAPGIASAGKNLFSVVPADIDGTARTITPSIGANQFSAAALTPLSGTYTVGTGQTYTTINAAIDAMKVNGISGPVTFLLNTQTFAERFILPSISGSSSTNTITFQAQSGNAADVVLAPAAATDGGTNYIAQLSNATFVTFRNLTFTPGTGTNFNRAIHVINRADDITFENLVITLPATTSVTEDRAAILARPSTSTNIRFINNTITGGSQGIVHIGNNSSRSPGTVFTGNTITNVFARPVYLEYMQDIIFNDNTISNTTAWSDYYGAGIQNTTGYLEMLRNRITGSVGHAVRLYYCSGLEAQPSIIANNFFHSNSSYATFYILYGLNYTNIYHNSVNNTSSGEAFHFNRHQSTGNRIVNNIFRANTAHAVEFQTSTAVNSILESNYNNLFTSGSFIGRDVSTNYGTFSDWQTATGFEANGLSIDPQYQSNTQLYTAVSALAAAGKNVNTEVPDDIDGIARPSTPSIGANQFGTSGTPLSGEYTINAAGSGTTNFTTITAALDALKNFGISGPVVFKVTGEFNEQLTFLAVSGSSTTNTVTFESATGQPQDAVIRFAATTSGSNFTIRLSNADHHRFRNLTIKAEGATYARVVDVINRLVDIRLEENIIESMVTTSTASHHVGIHISPAQSQNLLISNNTIRNGSYGILFAGPSSKATGTIISGNFIDKAYYHGIDLTNQTGFILHQNQVLNNPSANNFRGLDISSVDGAFQITANRVTGGNGSALFINAALSSAGSPGLIANNFFQTNNGSSFVTAFLSYLRNVNFYHNNINATGVGTAFQYTSAAGQNVNIINNIIKATSGPAVNISDPVALGQIDYNNYFNSGAVLGLWDNTTAANLTNWQSLSGQDVNSLSVDPQYQSESDLDALASSLAGAGLDLTSIVPTDINGVTRTLPVSIGASQFTAAFTTDGTISRIITPASSCALANTEDVRIEVTNLGSAAISGFQVGYELLPAAPVIESVPGAVTIPPGGKFEFTFTQKINLSAKQAYDLRAFLILTGDQNTANDEITLSFTHFPDLVTTVSNDLTICRTEATTLTATGGTGYQWSTGATTTSINVTPTATTTYTVLISNANGCQETKTVTVTVQEIPEISFTNDAGYTTSFVSPLQGASNAPFDFRMIYTDASGNLPASGFPRVELDANGNGLPTDPLDIIREMTELDPADTDATDGKEYRVTITNLSDVISWRSRIVAQSTDGCTAQTSFISRPLVSNDLLDIGIYANDISFSKANPAINESIKIYARVRNTSDYLAENFVVSAYIEEVQVFTQTITQLNPQTSVTLQWDQVFAAAGFYPVKVVIDETNVLDEDNELNNFAIRPILTGDYQLPGGINPDATASPLSLFPGQAVGITGVAQYFGIDAGVNPDVAGATAIARITGGSAAQTTTLPDGSYSLSVTAPLTPGTYSLNIEVTDYTLTGYQGPITVTVLPAPPQPDLSTIISLNTTTILPGESVSGTTIVQNIGNATATNFLFRYFSCDEVLGEELITSLAPGESRVFTFTTTTSVIGDCFNRNNCQFISHADVNNQVAERSEGNNQSAAYLTVLPDKPDLTPVNTTNGVIPGNVNMLNPFTFSVRVDNIGGVPATTPFDVNVYIDGALIHTQPIALLNNCEGNTFSVNHNFADTNDKVLTIRVDEPIGSGVVDEYRETNNEFSKTIRHIPPPPLFPNLNISNYDITVTPPLPAPGTNFDINLVYRSNGQVAVAAPFNIELMVTESGVPRIETQNVNETILPGTTRNVSLTTSLATDGNHTVRVRVDSDNSILESSEADNVAQMPLCVDFNVSPVGGVWGSFYVNTVQNLTASVYNYGLFTATDVEVSFFLDNVKIASEVIPVVQPGLTAGNYIISIPHLFDQAGTFELKVVVDELNAYTECREDNNEYKRNITVNVPAPDVRIFSEYISPSKINPDVGEPILLFLSYDNIGIGASGPFKARILVDDVPLGPDVDIPSVPAGDDGTIEVPTPYSSPTAGIRVIRAILDPDNELTETNKLNNVATRALVVGEAPNLLFTDLQADIACPDDGNNVIITATLNNAGDLQATAEVFFYYITESDTIPIETKSFTLNGNETTTVQTEWLVINKTYDLYAEIRNSDPLEYDETDNSIRTKLCGGPYFNLLVEANGQGIIQKTPNLNRYEGVQAVTVTAIPATGWVFDSWQGDATGFTNPLTVNLTSDQVIFAVFIEPLVAPTVTDGTQCGPGTVTLTASGAVGAQSYRWYTTAVGGTPIANETSATFTTPALTTNTSYFVSIASFSNESTRAEVQAIILPLPAQPTIAATGLLNCPTAANPAVLQAPSGFSGYLWSTGETTQQIEVTAAGTYTVQVLDANNCASIPSAGFTVTEEFCNELIVYNAISPDNGDDLNDYLIIRNIDILADARENKLKIYNRWGDLVFEATNYDNATNPFKGQTNNGKELPSGNYFYILEFNSNRPRMTGYISLKR